MTNRALRRIAILRAMVFPCVLAVCTVGPSYHRPPAPTPIAPRYKESPSNPQFRGVGWKVATPSDAMLRGKWWKVFREPELDALEDRLNISNQTIKLSYENYMAARALIRAARAQYFPTVATSPSVSISRSSGSFGGVGVGSGSATGTATTPTTTGGVGTVGSQGRITGYTVPATASWAPDLFGRVRNTVREFEYGAQVSAADLESQRLLVQSTLAATYFQIRGQDALQDMLDATVKADEQILDATVGQYETGLVPAITVAQAQQTLQFARVQATNAGILRAQFEHAIATLLGVPATDFTIPKRALLATPPPIPTGTPSQLLERRPDVAAAERLMAQANAVIGIGYAAYYPTLLISATGGFASTVLENLFTWPSRFWSIGTSLSETLFDAGLRRATIDQSIAIYNANVASYRQTVLTAFQQVEDFLVQLRILSHEIEQQEELVIFAQTALDLEKVRFETGLDPYITLMIQQTTLLAAQQTLILLQVQLMTTAVSLVEALGGGWDVSELPTPHEVAKKPRVHPRKSD